jgi:hypothetical protein
MRIRASVASLLAVLATATPALAQNWSFDARAIGMGGAGASGNLSTKMIDEQRNYTAIVLPFGLFQVFKDMDIYNPDSPKFDPVLVIEYAGGPLHYVIDRGNTNTGEMLFVTDIRNATLSRDLSRYRGFVPANDLLAEGLAAPNFGGTIKLVKGAGGSFQGIYLGAGPYLSVHDAATISPALTGVLSTGVNVPNATFPISNTDEAQVALAATVGYRGRFAWGSGIGSGSAREGLYVAANYNYLHGFQYEADVMAITLHTNSAGLIDVSPLGINNSTIGINHHHATDGHGFSIDAGVGAVIDRWEVGFGANGIGNRINWTGVQQTVYSLLNLTSGNSNFGQSPTTTVADARVELPVDYRGNVAYYGNGWSAAVEAGQGFGGGSFHAGLEKRVGRMEVRGGARYTFSKWNPTGGVGFDLSRKISLDVAAYGTNANIERTRRTAIAASIRFNHFK